MDRNEWLAAQTSLNLQDHMDLHEVAIILVGLVLLAILAVLTVRFFSALCEFGFQTLRRFHRAQENAIREPLPNPFDQTAKQRRWAKIEEVRPTYEGAGRPKAIGRP